MAPKKPLHELSTRQLYRRANTYRHKIEAHDFGTGDALIAAGIVGGALATAIALRAAKKHGEASATLIDANGEIVSVHDGPAQYMKNAVSIVRRDGSAASFPEGEEEAERLRREAGGDASIFLTESGGHTTHIVRSGLEDSPAYRKAIDYGAHLVRLALHRPPEQ